MLRSFVLKTTEQLQTKVKHSVSINHCLRHVLFGHFSMSLSLNSFFKDLFILSMLCLHAYICIRQLPTRHLSSVCNSLSRDSLFEELFIAIAVLLLCSCGTKEDNILEVPPTRPILAPLFLRGLVHKNSTRPIHNTLHTLIKQPCSIFSVLVFMETYS